MIAAIFETRVAERWPVRSPRAALYEALYLLVAAAAPALLLGPAFGSLIALFLLLMHQLWVVVFPLYDPGPRQPGKISLLNHLHWFSITLIFTGSLFIAVHVWMDPNFQNGTTPVIVIALFAIMIVPPVLFITVAPRLARGNGDEVSHYLAGILAHGYGQFHRNWFGLIFSTLGFMAAITFVALFLFLSIATLTRGVEGVETVWDLAIAYPILPLALLIAVTMQPLGRHLLYDRAEVDAMVRACTKGVASGLELDKGTNTVLGALAAGGFMIAVVVGSGSVQLLGSAPSAHAYQTEISKAVDGWVDGQREAGTTTVEIAATLNEAGAWTPDAPQAGLATLIGEAGDVFADRCSVATAAGVADLSGHGSIAWLPADQAGSNLKYCIRMTCPMAGQAAPLLIFVSSHSSRTRIWNRRGYTDLFGQGRAPRPGGYCTADGDLADEFQG